MLAGMKAEEREMNAHKTTCLIVSLILFSCLAGHLPAKETFTLEQVLSPPYPWGLTSAKKANRIAWIFYYQGERNVWTAAAPDFKPVNLTGYAKDQVFELPDVYLTEDGKTAVYIKNGRPNSVGWVTNADSGADGREQEIWAVRTDGGTPWKLTSGANPELSPDGNWILIVRDGLIYRLSLKPPLDKSSQAEPELLFRAAGQNGNPRWSSDSARIAFVSNRKDLVFQQ